MKFTACSQGDRTVGDFGHVADIDMPYWEPQNGGDLQNAKNAIQRAFEDIWEDDVIVYTEEEMRDDAESR